MTLEEAAEVARAECAGSIPPGVAWSVTVGPREGYAGDVVLVAASTEVCGVPHRASFLLSGSNVAGPDGAATVAECVEQLASAARRKLAEVARGE